MIIDICGLDSLLEGAMICALENRQIIKAYIPVKYFHKGHNSRFLIQQTVSEFVHRVPSSEVYIQNRRLYDMCGEKIGAKLLTDVNQELRKTTQGLFLNQLDSIGFPTEKIRHVDPEWVWRRFKYVFCRYLNWIEQDIQDREQFVKTAWNSWGFWKPTLIARKARKDAIRASAGLIRQGIYKFKCDMYMPQPSGLDGLGYARTQDGIPEPSCLSCWKRRKCSLKFDYAYKLVGMGPLIPEVPMEERPQQISNWFESSERSCG